MKKAWQLALGLAVAVMTLSLFPSFRAWASVEGTWFYHLLIVNGPTTLNGNLTVANTTTFNGPVNLSSTTIFGSGGGAPLAVGTTIQLSTRIDPIGTTFLVSWGAVPGYGVCAATAAAVASYVWVSTPTAANLGKPCI